VGTLTGDNIHTSDSFNPAYACSEVGCKYELKGNSLDMDAIVQDFSELGFDTS
jgi:hypothetical protein